MNFKKFLAATAIAFVMPGLANAQEAEQAPEKEGWIFSEEVRLPITSMKDQNAAGTCWCYSTLSFVEAELLRTTGKTYDFSEMFIVWNTYMDRAQATVRTHGDISFSQGGSFYDVLYGIKHFGLVPDSELPAGVKIVNPDCVICTLSQGGSIHADITVEVGKGYVANDILKEQKNGLPIDLLPIDAVFMPIKRVSYNVEPARVGESLDFDKLTLEIWSNGSIEVGAALSKASNLLIEHFSQIAGTTGTPVQVKQEVVEVAQVEEVAAPTLSIEDLELSVRAYNCLKRASINSMTELLKKSEHDLLNIKNFGKKSSDEVIEKLHQMGLDLQPNPEEADDLELI